MTFNWIPNMVEVLFNGPAGRIEGVYHKSNFPLCSHVALILHPNPQCGGSMNNEIVYYLYKTFILNKFSVLRINFRGVGKSTGDVAKNCADGLSDAATAMDWLQNKFTGNMIYWVAGVSYGAWIAMQLLMRRPEIVNFVSFSPPVGLYDDFTFLSPCPASGLIVQGDNDSIVKEENVRNLITHLKKQKKDIVEYHVIKGANHLFENSLDKVTSILDDYVKKRMQISEEDLKNATTDKKRRRLKV